jgi:hypothetical protein
MITNLPPHITLHLKNLLTNEGISFRLASPRKSKFGDYRYHKINKTHCISVNKNLNPYAFTITFLHEVAHKTAFTKYGFKILPHGKEWKSEFQHLLIEMLGKDFFPEAIIAPLLKYIDNPKATTSSSPQLLKALAQHDQTSSLILEEIKDGEHFIYNKKQYTKIKKRRTRSLCIELISQKRYLILETTPVEV